MVNYGFDLTTIVLTNEVRDLQIAYLRSGVANQDVPQDHAFLLTCFGSKEKRVQHIISGGNIATESIFPSDGCDAMDSANLKISTKNLEEYL